MKENQIKIIPIRDFPHRVPREFYPEQDLFQIPINKVNIARPSWLVTEDARVKIASILSEEIAEKSIRLDVNGMPR